MRTVSWRELPNDIFVTDLYIVTSKGMERVMKFAHIFKKNHVLLLSECSQWEIEIEGNPRMLVEFEIPFEDIEVLRFDDASYLNFDTTMLSPKINPH